MIWDWIGKAVDVMVASVRRNSRRGTGTGHYFPTRDTRIDLGLPKHTCMYCFTFDAKERKHTKSPCTGRPT